MTRSEIATTVKKAICKHFNIPQLDEGVHLWDDLGADDLDFVELSLVLEEEIPETDFRFLPDHKLRDYTVACLIEHVDLMINPPST